MEARVFTRGEMRLAEIWGVPPDQVAHAAAGRIARMYRRRRSRRLRRWHRALDGAARRAGATAASIIDSGHPQSWEASGGSVCVEFVRIV